AGYAAVPYIIERYNFIDGGAGDDIIYTDYNNQYSPNSVTGGAGTDTFYGGAGVDQYTIARNAEISGLAEYIDGGGGTNDSLIFLRGGKVDLTHATMI